MRPCGRRDDDRATAASGAVELMRKATAVVAVDGGSVDRRARHPLFRAFQPNLDVLDCPNAAPRRHLVLTTTARPVVA